MDGTPAGPRGPGPERTARTCLAILAARARVPGELRDKVLPWHPQLLVAPVLAATPWNGPFAMGDAQERGAPVPGLDRFVFQIKTDPNFIK